MQVNFKPTYKFDVGTNAYDTSEKRRPNPNPTPIPNLKPNPNPNPKPNPNPSPKPNPNPNPNLNSNPNLRPSANPNQVREAASARLVRPDTVGWRGRYRRPDTLRRVPQHGHLRP